MGRKALLHNARGHNTEFDQKVFKKYGSVRNYLASKFAKAALMDDSQAVS